MLSYIAKAINEVTTAVDIVRPIIQLDMLASFSILSSTITFDIMYIRIIHGPSEHSELESWSSLFVMCPATAHSHPSRMSPKTFSVENFEKILASEKINQTIAQPKKYMRKKNT